jgi:hypothetical protein
MPMHASIHPPAAQRLRHVHAAANATLAARPHSQDGALNDAELNAFQVWCFSAPLQPHELMGVKDVVRQHRPQARGALLPFAIPSQEPSVLRAKRRLVLGERSACPMQTLSCS